MPVVLSTSLIWKCEWKMWQRVWLTSISFNTFTHMYTTCMHGLTVCHSLPHLWLMPTFGQTFWWRERMSRHSMKTIGHIYASVMWRWRWSSTAKGDSWQLNLSINKYAAHFCRWLKNHFFLKVYHPCYRSFYWYTAPGEWTQYNG